MRASDLTQLPKGVTVYVDMDGVLADLFNHVGAIHDVEHYNRMTKEQWEEFFKTTNAYELFKSLPAFSTANKLLSMVKNFAGGYKILSSPLSFDKEGSIKGKKEWLKKHISVPADAWIFEHEKQKYATANGIPNILIDDYGVNIRNWQAAGGIAIKYQADEDALQKILDGLKDAKEILSNNPEESIDEGKKKRRKKSRWAAYGPGPYGYYGTAVGYSGDGGGGDGGAVGEELTDEGWKDWVAGAALGAASLGANANNIAYQPVEKGDTVYSIARQNGVSPQEIMKLNNFNKDTKLKIGQEVKVPDNFKDEQPAKKPAVTKANVKKPEAKKVIDVSKTLTGTRHEAILTAEARKSGITDPVELAALLSQCAHESHDFKSMVEYGGSLDFRKYDPKYAPKKAKALGNKKVGDGARYKGRGYIQLTGRYNYKRAGQALGLPLEQKPELVEKPEIAAKVAVWFWKQRVQPNVNNFNDVTSVTKPINPGLNGLDDRKEAFIDFKKFKLAMR